MLAHWHHKEELINCSHKVQLSRKTYIAEALLVLQAPNSDSTAIVLVNSSVEMLGAPAASLLWHQSPSCSRPRNSAC